ncbi:MAG: arginine--tRNA ligase, partial [Oscillospiraceae bacterium]|nr:arginine--tRNA ligase [Oscillospiraceae bacterium]
MVVNCDLVHQAKEQVRSAILAAVTSAVQARALPAAGLPEFAVEIPADTAHGDFAANIAMVSAKLYRMPPVKIAQAIVDHIDFTGTELERAEIAGPGFLNFFLRESWFAHVLEAVRDLGEAYGRTTHGGGRKVMVEFVSANPTGPMHMGNARGAAIGDCLAAALSAAGYDVEREFYVNDAGNQVEKFGLSLEARYLQIFKGEDTVPFPEDGYHGDDIKERAREYADSFGDALLDLDSEARQRKLVDYAMPRNIEKLRDDLLTYRVNYDTWFHESKLHETGALKEMMDLLREKGLTYEKEGALWYKATEHGGEKDEVLVRGNGHPTYFAADIAYHYNKFAVRGFWKVINIWGADHHGHVARLKGAMDAIGLSGDMLEIVLMQFVRLIKDGEPYKMSKRTGRSITLSDLIEEVPVDAARYFFNMREVGSTIDFDMDLAAEQSSHNPVYYVQYAHARICSIFSKIKADGVNVRDC